MSGSAEILKSMQKGGVTARVERRTWYVDGKYLGNASQFLPVLPEMLAEEMSGHYINERGERRYCDGYASLAADVEYQIDYHLSVSARNAHHGSCHHHPVSLGDWGEYRIVTDDTALAAARAAHKVAA